MPSLRTALGIPAIPDVPVTTTDTAVTRSSHHADISISSHQAAIHQQTTTTLKSRHPPPPPPAAAAAAPKVTSTDPEKQAFQKLLQETAQKSQSKLPRTYRQLDGSLGPEPPRNPKVVASRKRWNPLVRYCLMETMAADERAGVKPTNNNLMPLACYRHHVGTTYRQHESFLNAMGLKPEVHADGTWCGESEGDDVIADALDPALLRWIGAHNSRR
eukprot:CAMPEP_0119194726 /NCGR_PEP_ID=MMETSP1316-20130426/4405_1 /TAXON_ID=41880 /ORGANISM="Pycnococcus provasolii, Strain RCC2336" /LENGTH=215 /DNA_ID=CAMNT_0007190079 /DNA_START=46 /DNA_END=693 /DNA_ORIENTATION=-